jgi:Ca2+-binding RTX toxin-like protein
MYDANVESHGRALKKHALIKHMCTSNPGLHTLALISGTSKNDSLTGTSGNDIIIGGAGSDTISGGAGNDRMRGSAGDDILTGGSGADTFVFYRAEGDDRINDFQQGVDRLEFRGISGREITWTATDGGVTVSYGGMAGQAADHGEIFVAGITALGFSDFIFS